MLLLIQLNLFLILVLSVPSFYSSLVEVKKDLFYVEPCSGEKNKNYISKKYIDVLSSTVLLTD